MAMEEYTTMYIRFYRLAPPAVAGGVPVKTHGLDSEGMYWLKTQKHKVPAEGEWYELDVKRWIRAWAHDPSMNHGIVITAEDTVGEPQVVSLGGYDNTYVSYGQWGLCLSGRFPDSKVHGANMGPIWGRQDPDGPHVGPMN